MRKKLGLLFCTALSVNAIAQKPADTELYKPVPPKVTPSALANGAPSDAIMLFDGSNLNEWVSTKDTTKPAQWTIKDGAFTVKKGSGNIQTKRAFNNYQLHLEWKIPTNITGKSQARGNSGLFLASTGPGDDGYEIQILDNYNNDTYVNGQAGSIYKQFIPLATVNKAPGQWQTYDIVWTAPTFSEDGKMKTPARVTAFFNGVLVQNNIELLGPTQYIGKASYQKPHGPTPIKLQDHGDPSEPISFRNIWIREL